MKIGSKAFIIVLLFVGLVLVNYLASSIPARADLTAESIYSLSPCTKALLRKIEEPITLELVEWVEVTSVRDVEPGTVIAEQAKLVPGVELLLEGTALAQILDGDRAEPVGRRNPAIVQDAHAPSTPPPFARQ